STTADVSATKPFNLISYCLTGLNNNTGTSLASTAWSPSNFGTLIASGVPAYDATINFVGLLNGVTGSLTRSNTLSTPGNDFTISHNFLINNGILDFNASPNSCTVTGNLTVAAGGTLKLSTQAGGQGGGGITLGGTFSNSGSFVPNNGS